MTLCLIIIILNHIHHFCAAIFHFCAKQVQNHERQSIFNIFNEACNILKDNCTIIHALSAHNE